MSTSLQVLPGQTLNARVPYIDREELMERAEAPKVYIYNLSPKQFVHYAGTLGRFIVPDCKEGAELSAPLVIDGWLKETGVDSVEGRDIQFKWLWTSGRKLAQDIIGVGPHKTELQRLTKYGVFVSASQIPTEEEFAAAKAELNKTYDALIKEADDKYQVNGGMEMGDDGKYHSAITVDHITAARYRGVKRPWLFAARTEMKMCDECGTENLFTAGFCKQCDNLLNEEAAKRKFPARYAERMAAMEPVKRPVGRPRNEDVA